MNGRIECAFIGTIISVADVKTSAAGKPWIALKLACGQGDEVQWIRTVAFGDLAVGLASAEKGSKVYVEGSIRLDRWKNAEGEDRAGLSCAAWKVERVGASAICRNRPPRQKPPPEGSSPAPFSTVGDKEQAARRDWQRPADADLLPF